MLPKDVYITGYARSKMSDEELRSKVKPNLKGDEKVVEDFLKTFSYTAGAYDEAGGFQQLTKKLEEYEKKHSNVPVGRLFYLALPPSVYPQVASFNIFENEQKHTARISLLCYLAMLSQGCHLCQRVAIVGDFLFTLHMQVCKGIKENCDELPDREGSWLRVVVEKPFGKDLESSEKLADELGALYPEKSIYR